MVKELRSPSRALGNTHGLLARRELPSHDALVAIARSLRSVLFPAHFGPSDLTEEGLEYFVGHTLDATLLALHEQVRRALSYADHSAPRRDRATEIVRAFASRLPHVRALLDSDARAAFDGDPAATSIDEAIFCYPGIAAVTLHRLAHELYRLEVPLIPRIVAEIAHADTGVDLHPGAEIGGSFFIDHGTAVVVGETTRIGERVRLYQGVTLGAKSFPLDDDGNPTKGEPRHPIVEDDVVIYAGATVLGRIRIGAGSTIGGNVWLTRSVPPHSRVTQAQARSEAFEGGGGI
ncbi:MAG: serine acetyltransferase [Myxococcales bacterium]|nr:MAG: serine acetyltransferase [Myxococcales bacterium]